jgi:hypothetical protein
MAQLLADSLHALQPLLRPVEVSQQHLAEAEGELGGAAAAGPQVDEGADLS